MSTISFLPKRAFRGAVLAGLGVGLCAGSDDLSAFGGARVQITSGLPIGNPSLSDDTRGHVGSGVGIYLGARSSETNAFRLSLDFTGTEAATWYYTFPNRADSIEYKDIWRSFRLAGEHEFTLSESGGLYALWGGGVEESWVNRTEGSFLEVSVLAWAWTQGATSGSARYSTKSTALDGYHPFASVGLGLRTETRRGRGMGDVELRYIVGPYRRYKATGLRTTAEGPTETALGHRVVLSWAFRLGE